MALKFGTSGLRWLVEELTNENCYLYTKAYLKYLDSKNMLTDKVFIAGDLRPSTDRIMQAAAAAIEDYGQEVVNCGKVATPVLSYYAFIVKQPSIMVTGSHIPFDRNGIKFNMPTGEVLKGDEKEITNIYQSLNVEGCTLIKLPKVDNKARVEFIARFQNFFSKELLEGKKIVVYQHSSVIRDLFPEILESFGAEVVKVGFSEEFIPLDTESPTPESIQIAAESVDKYQPDAIISFDGDGDRPLLFNKKGECIRGDVLGIICAKFLWADSVSCPVSCNTALEKSGWFKSITRTKIGSPYVIEGMNKAIEEGKNRVVSYEANGGFLTGTEIDGLLPLPTRDCVLPVLAALAMGLDMIEEISGRFTYCNTIKEFAREKSLDMIENIEQTCQQLEIGNVKKIDFTDGARMILENENIVHLRPSGNAPELRCYTEACSEKEAKELADKICQQIEEKLY